MKTLQAALVLVLAAVPLGRVWAAQEGAAKAPAHAAPGEETRYLGKPLAHWTGVLEDEKSPAEVRARAVKALGAALADPSSEVRVAAGEALGEIGPAAGAALPALRMALADEDKWVRKEAARAIKSIEAKPSKP